MTYAGFTIAFGAAINRAKFAESIFVANFQIGRFAGIFQILRLLADRTVGVKFIFRARLHRPGKGDMMLQPASFAQHDPGADNTIRTNDCSGAQLCFWINNCSRMDLRVAHFKQCGGI